MRGKKERAGMTDLKKEEKEGTENIVYKLLTELAGKISRKQQGEQAGKTAGTTAKKQPYEFWAVSWELFFS